MTALTITHINKKKMPHLYGPASNWKIKEEYPPLKPDSQMTAQDYLRLAWEVLRRSPRYRWHFERLKRSNLLNSQYFSGEIFHFAENTPRMFDRRLWPKIIAEDHFCMPPAAHTQNLVEYAAQNNGSNWQVVHGTRWVKELWGVLVVQDPGTKAEDIDLKTFFAPSFPHISNSSLYELMDAEGKECKREIPLEIDISLSPQDILFKLRLDTPYEGQIQLLKEALKAAQKAAKCDKVNSGARLTDAGLSSIWLRGWDAMQLLEMDDLAKADQEQAGKIIKTPFPRKSFIDRLRADVDELPKELKKLATQQKKSEPQKTFENKLDLALRAERIDNWIYRAKKYVQENSYFYRRAIAASLDRLEYKNFAPGKTLHPPTYSGRSDRT